MALELEGTIRQFLGVQSGTSARGEWVKQEFVLDYPDGNYTSQAVFLAWGQDKVKELEKFKVGDKVKVSFNLKSREYNGRWYTDIQIWRIAPAGGAAPVAPASAPVAPAPSVEDMPAADLPEDDLPF